MDSNVIRSRLEPKRAGRARARLFGRFRSRHPYVEKAAKNLALTAAVTAPMALVSRGKFRAARGVLREVGVTYSAIRDPGTMRVLFRKSGRGIRIRMGARPEGSLSLRIARGRARGAAMRETRRLHLSGMRWRAGARFTAMTGTTGSVLGPLGDWGSDRREMAAALRRAHPVIVHSRKTGERRVFYT